MMYTAYVNQTKTADAKETLIYNNRMTSTAKALNQEIVKTQTATITPSLTMTNTTDPLMSTLAENIAQRKSFTPTPQLTNTPRFTVTPAVASSQIREKDGMEMVYVPAGEFIMGSDDGDKNEAPAHEVYLDSYWIDKYEVTNYQYAKCVEDGDCLAPGNDYSSLRENYYGTNEYADFPVIYVDWNDASAYCSWAGGTLPTEAQWEKAARGTDENKYPWWDREPNCHLANYGGRSGCVGDTSPVGNQPIGSSPYGALDMAGNVGEWVLDKYNQDYYSNSPKINPIGPTYGDYFNTRGGSWYRDEETIIAYHRRWTESFYHLDYIGFRCASSENESIAQFLDRSGFTPTPTSNNNPSFDVKKTPFVGSTAIREKDRMEMVLISNGTFMMGSENWSNAEKPIHEIYLDAYWIDKYEVTNQQFSQFVEESDYITDAKTYGSSIVYAFSLFNPYEIRDGANWMNPFWLSDRHDDQLPVVQVSWNDASAYCSWIGGNLPTEAQWEKAARGVDGRTYPWGNSFANEFVANFNGENVDDGYHLTSPVGNYPAGASPYGVLDMAGNA